MVLTCSRSSSDFRLERWLFRPRTFAWKQTESEKGDLEEERKTSPPPRRLLSLSLQPLSSSCFWDFRSVLSSDASMFTPMKCNPGNTRLAVRQRKTDAKIRSAQINPSLLFHHLLQLHESSLLLLQQPLDVLFLHHGQETLGVQVFRWMCLCQDLPGPGVELSTGGQLTTGGRTQTPCGNI